MAVLSDYITGQIVLTNGSVNFTGIDTGWLAADFKEGDTVFDITGQNQWTAVIASIDSNTSGTFTKPFQGTSGTYAYRMRYLADNSRVAAQARTLIELLGDGNILSFASLEGSQGKIPIFASPGNLELIDSAALADSSITVIGTSGLTGGGDLTANRTISLDAASIASLAKADTAVQPAGLTKDAVGLGNVDNTSDLTKPISTATQTALNLKADASKAVRVDVSQPLTPAEQGQALSNIGAGVLSGFRNKIINGDFDIWQRGTSFTSNGYNADRWQTSSSGTLTISRGYLGAGDGIPGTPQFGLRTNRTVAAASGNVVLGQKIEGLRQFSGQRVTLTFYIRNLTGVAKELNTRARSEYGSGGSANEELAMQTHSIAVAPGYQKFTHVFDIPSMAGKTFGSGDCLYVRFLEEAGFSTFDLIFSHISLVIGDASAEEDPFSPRHIQQELALCQRYYWRGLPVQGLNFASYDTGCIASWPIAFPVPMRSIPTVAHNLANTTYNGCDNLEFDVVTTFGGRILVQSTEIAPNAHFLFGAGDYLEADAEL